MQRGAQITSHYSWCPQQCRSFSSGESDYLLLQKKTLLERGTFHTTQGGKWNQWLEENRAFPKQKVTEQMKFSHPSLSIVHGNQLIDLQYKSTLCILETMGLRNVTNIKSAEWLLIDFFYQMLNNFTSCY